MTFYIISSKKERTPHTLTDVGERTYTSKNVYLQTKTLNKYFMDFYGYFKELKYILHMESICQKDNTTHKIQSMSFCM